MVQISQEFYQICFIPYSTTLSIKNSPRKEKKKAKAVKDSMGCLLLFKLSLRVSFLVHMLSHESHSNVVSCSFFSFISIEVRSQSTFFCYIHTRIGHVSSVFTSESFLWFLRQCIFNESLLEHLYSHSSLWNS